MGENLLNALNVANIKEPYFNCNAKEQDFVHLLVEGLAKDKAYKQSFESNSSNKHYLDRKARGLLAGAAGIYYRALMTELLADKLLPTILTREQRLLMLTTLAALAFNQYEQDREPQQAAIIIKTINAMNLMTGENAATEVNVSSTYINADLTKLSPHEATRQYKDMMRNIHARIKITPENATLTIDEEGEILDDDPEDLNIAPLDNEIH